MNRHLLIKEIGKRTEKGTINVFGFDFNDMFVRPCSTWFPLHKIKHIFLIKRQNIIEIETSHIQ